MGIWRGYSHGTVKSMRSTVLVKQGSVLSWCQSPIALEGGSITFTEGIHTPEYGGPEGFSH